MFNITTSTTNWDRIIPHHHNGKRCYTSGDLGWNLEKLDNNGKMNNTRKSCSITSTTGAFQ